MPAKCSTPVLQRTFLSMDSQNQYKLFENHLLSPLEFEDNEYPQEHPHYPGKIDLARNSLFNRRTDERSCSRCKQKYANHSNFPHCRVFPCFYHPKKVASGIHPCCGRARRSSGCTRGMYHVSVECDLSSVTFEKTRPGRSKYACNVFALDCEMVFTMGGMELAKVGIVGVDGRTVYESFVRPEEPILDYNTLYSGVTKEDLMFGNAVSFAEAQEIVLGLVTQDTILVGQSLESDLRSLRIIHTKVVDTSILFPHEQPGYKKSLKSLAAEFLNKDIQTAATGHSCIEDARTAMELVLHKINMDLLPACLSSLAPSGSDRLNTRSPSPLPPQLNSLGLGMGGSLDDPGMNTQDENNQNTANTSEQSSTVHFLNSLAYLQQHDRSGMRCTPFIQNQPNAFGFRHNGEWYPICVPYTVNGGLCFYGPY